MQDVGESLLFCTESGDESGDQRAESDQSDRECSNDCVEMNVFDSARILTGVDEPQQSGFGQANTGDTAESREKQGFDEAFAHEAQPSASERGSDRKVLLPCSCAGDKQISDVEAGDQKNTRRRAQQNVQRALHVAHQVLDQWTAVGSL